MSLDRQKRITLRRLAAEYARARKRRELRRAAGQALALIAGLLLLGVAVGRIWG